MTAARGQAAAVRPAVRPRWRARPTSRGFAPSEYRAFTSKSTETDLSPTSIFATGDWLDFNRRARSPCVRPWARLERSAWLSANRIPTKAASSWLKSRKSFAEPTRQRRAFSRVRFVLSMSPVVVAAISSKTRQ